MQRRRTVPLTFEEKIEAEKAKLEAQAVKLILSRKHCLERSRNLIPRPLCTTGFRRRDYNRRNRPRVPRLHSPQRWHMAIDPKRAFNIEAATIAAVFLGVALMIYILSLNV